MIPFAVRWFWVRLFALSCISTSLAISAQAQINNVGDDTAAPIEGAGHDYIKMLSETVNPANGLVSLRIQVPTAEARGITLPFSFNYDSNGVNHIVGGAQPTPQSDFTVVSQGGWSYGLPIMQGIGWSSTSSEGVTCLFNSGYTFQDPSGGRHSLGLGVTGGQTLCGTQDYLYGSDTQYSGALVLGYTGNVLPTLIVSDAHGTAYNFPSAGASGTLGNCGGCYSQLPSYIEDSNGNQIVLSSSGGAFTYVDSAGRNAISWNGPGTSGQTNTVTASGAAYQVNWTSTTPNFSFPNELVYTVQGYNCEPFAPVNQTETVVNTITLPNEEAYQFYYGTNNPHQGYSNPYGLLSEIDYPTGAWVRYTWKYADQYSEGVSYDGIGTGSNAGQEVPTFCQSIFKTPVIATRSVGLAGSSTPILTQSFSYTTTWAANGPEGPAWTTKQTTVTTTDNVRNLTTTTKYTYTPYGIGPNNPYIPNFTADQIPLESTVTYSTWGGGSTIRTVSKTWDNQFELASEQDTYNNLTSEVTYQYGINAAQITQQKEYDYSNPAGTTLLRETVTNYQGFTASPIFNGNENILDRPCQVITYDGNNNRYAEADYYYDGGTSLCPSTASTQSLTGTGSYTGHDETNYGTSSTAPRGNLTQKIRWANTGTSPQTTYTYDETGQVVSKTDPCGNPNGTCSDMTGSTHTTNYSHANSYTILSGGENVSYSPSGNTNTYLTSVTDALGHISSFSYDYNNGQLTISEDPNLQNTTYLYNDPFNRPSQVNYPDGGQTSLSYVDSSTPTVTTTELISSAGSGISKVTTNTADSLGRQTTAELSSDPDGPTYTATTYDGENNVYTQSNPYRTTSDPTYGITTYTYDSIGRLTKKAEPDGSTVTSSYAGNQTTVTDEAGNQRENQLDGMGRLTDVWEAPNVSGYDFQTIYTYDPLNDLTLVTQNGSNSSNARIRHFYYDSLSRLTSAVNPESGTIGYSYDANGNLRSKTALSPNQPTNGTATVTTSYAYDALNRLTGKSYADSYTGNPPTSSVAYAYDGNTLTCPTGIAFVGSGATNGIGRRPGMCDGEGSASWTHDPMGRVSAQNRVFINLAPPYNPNTVSLWNGIEALSTDTSYAYYLNGDLGTVFYPHPNGPPNYEFYTRESAAGRVIGAGDTVYNVVWTASYAPQGALATANIGWSDNGNQSYNGSPISNTYNNRLAPVIVSAQTGANSPAPILNLTYSFNLGNGTSGTDNGNVIGIVNGKDHNRSQNFLYDPLNRIQQAYTTGPNWGETFASVATNPGVPPSLSTAGIDAWGNLTNRSGVNTKSVFEPLTCSPAGITNQLRSCYTYDPAGNLTKSGSTAYIYDAENRLIETSGYSYIYDGDGQRLEKCTAGATPGTCASNATGILYYLTAAGAPLAESDLGGNWTEAYGVIRGQIFSRVDLTGGESVVHYYFHDHLNSTSVVTDNFGNVQNESDYYPYGGEIVITQSDSNRYKFTGKERDAETCATLNCLDYLGARHYASSIGRFMTPDWATKPTAVPYAHYGNPQSLNLYSYVNNNPTTTADLDGHCPWCPAVEDLIESPAGEAVENWGAQALAGAGALIGTVFSASGGGRPPSG